MKRIALTLALATLWIGGADAATLNVTPGSGTPLALSAADANSNQSVLGIICGATSSATLNAACANQAFVNASGQLGITGPVTQSGSWTVSVSNTNANGQATMANSSPVVIASNQSAVAVSQASPTTASATNPTSTLTLTSTTTAYTAGQIIANNATAGSITVPSFAIANSAGAFTMSKAIMTSNDSTSTAWGGQTIQIDFWTAAPTFTNGDRAAYAVATGSAGYIGSMTCVMSAVAGDGVYAVCAPTVGTSIGPIKLASGTSVYWTLDAVTGSGVTGASKVFTLTAELTN